MPEAEGTSPTSFSPNKTCTRSEILKFLYSALGRPAHSGKNPYPDVKRSHWYYDSAIWAYENGLEQGNHNKFKPKTACTRGSVVTYLYRFFTADPDHVHEFQVSESAASCTDAAYRVERCAGCGLVKSYILSPALEHAWVHREAETIKEQGYYCLCGARLTSEAAWAKHAAGPEDSCRVFGTRDDEYYIPAQDECTRCGYREIYRDCWKCDDHMLYTNSGVHAFCMNEHFCEVYNFMLRLRYDSKSVLRFWK